MALEISYGTTTTVTASNWEGLADDAWASLPAVQNTSNFVDILIGGEIEFDTATGTITADGTFDIYVSARYDDATASSYTGGIDALLTANDSTLTKDQDLNPLNMNLLAVVNPEQTTADTNQAYVWGPVSVAAAFGGVLPEYFILVAHNQTGGTTETATSTTEVKYVGIKYADV